MKRFYLILITLLNMQVAFSQHLNFAWYNTIKGSVNLPFVTSDSKNNFIVAGTGSGSIIYKNDTIEAGTDENSIILKINSAGDLIWAKVFKHVYSDRISCLVTDSLDNIYFSGAINYLWYGPQNIWKNMNAYLSKVDSTGNLIWIKVLQDTTYLHNGWNNVSKLIFKGNNIYAGGSFSNNLIIQNTTIAPTGPNNVFIIKYDLSGNLIDYNVLGNSNLEFYDFAVNDSSEINTYIGFTGNVVLNNTTYSSTTYMDKILISMSPNYTIKWVKQLNGFANCTYMQNFICLDNDGNIYLTGCNFNNLNLCGTSYVATGFEDIIFVKFDRNGICQIIKNLYGQGEDVAYQIQPFNNKIYLIGMFYNSIFLDDTLVGDQNRYNLFISYSDNDTIIPIGYYSTPGTNALTAFFTMNSNNELLIAGHGPCTINNTFMNNVFIGKINNSVTSINPTMKNNFQMFKCYPNPANNFLLIELDKTISGTLSISNLNGQELIRQQLKEIKTQIDITNLSNGVYFVKLITDKTVDVKKIIKK